MQQYLGPSQDNLDKQEFTLALLVVMTDTYLTLSFLYILNRLTFPAMGWGSLYSLL